MEKSIVKISGEALLGEKEYGIDNNVVDRIASEMKDVGHNCLSNSGCCRRRKYFQRKCQLSNKTGMVRATADSMGMLNHP